MEVYIGDRIKTLRNGVFGNATFEYVYFYSTSLSNIEELVFRGSSNTLTQIDIIYSSLTTIEAGI